jgi:hypothetical protein
MTWNSPKLSAEGTSTVTELVREALQMKVYITPTGGGSALPSQRAEVSYQGFSAGVEPAYLPGEIRAGQGDRHYAAPFVKTRENAHTVIRGRPFKGSHIRCVSSLHKLGPKLCRCGITGPRFEQEAYSKYCTFPCPCRKIHPMHK